MFSSKDIFHFTLVTSLFILATIVTMCAALLMSGCAFAYPDDVVDESTEELTEEASELPDVMIPDDTGEFHLDAGQDAGMPVLDSGAELLDTGSGRLDTGFAPVDSGACLCVPGAWLPTGCNDHVCSYGNTGNRCNYDCHSLAPCDMLPGHTCVIPSRDAGWATLEIQFEARGNFGSAADFYFRAPPLDGGSSNWSRMRCRGLVGHFDALDSRRDVYDCHLDPTGLPWNARGESSGSTLSFFVAIRVYPDWSYLAACPPDHSSVCPSDPFINRFRVLLNGVVFQGAPQLWAVEDTTANATVINFRFP